MTVRLFVMWIVISGLWPTLAMAQVVTVLNPTTVEFSASADHDTLVDTYELQLFAMAADGSVAAAPESTTSLGKPPLDNQGKVIAKPALLLGIPIGRKFVARVAAQGPTGAGVSVPSNPFERRGTPASPGPPTIR